jgi:hypothetical protein
MNEASKQLLRSLKATAGSRFNAAKRMAYLDRRLTALLALASIAVIGLSILPFVFEVTAPAQRWIAMVTVLLSLLILASTLLQYACTFGVRAELYHRSGLEIQAIKRELQFKSGDIREADFAKFSSSYNDVLQRYALNHDDVDFYRQQLEYPEDFPMGCFERMRKSVKLFVAYQYPNAVILALILLTGWTMTRSIMSQ